MKKIKIIAALSAVITAVLLLIFLSGIDNNDTVEINRVPVLTAAIDIPANTVITEEMLLVKELPEEAAISDSINEISLALGKTTKSVILKDEQILSAKLITAGENGDGTLAYAITPGMRAITVDVNATTGLAGMLKPSNKIDIINEFAYQDKIISSLILDNIKILAVDSVLSEQGINSTGGEGGYTTITLEVTPEQALKMSMASYQGVIRAILRSPLDNDPVNIENKTIEIIVSK